MRIIFFDRVFFRFFIVGVLNTITGALVMFALYNIVHTGYWFSSAVAYVAGSIASFFLNKYFTFKVTRWSFIMAITFILTIVISYFVSYGVARPLMKYLLHACSTPVRDNIALLFGMCLFTALNYLGQRFIVFTA